MLLLGEEGVTELVEVVGGEEGEGGEVHGRGSGHGSDRGSRLPVVSGFRSRGYFFCKGLNR